MDRIEIEVMHPMFPKVRCGRGHVSQVDCNNKLYFQFIYRKLSSPFYCDECASEDYQKRCLEQKKLFDQAAAEVLKTPLEKMAEELGLRSDASLSQ